MSARRSIRDLGRETRSKFPGQFDDIPDDAALGRATKETYPDQHADVVDDDPFPDFSGPSQPNAPPAFRPPPTQGNVLSFGPPSPQQVQYARATTPKREPFRSTGADSALPLGPPPRSPGQVDPVRSRPGDDPYAAARLNIGADEALGAREAPGLAGAYEKHQIREVGAGAYQTLTGTDPDAPWNAPSSPVDSRFGGLNRAAVGLGMAFAPVALPLAAGAAPAATAAGAIAGMPIQAGVEHGLRYAGAGPGVSAAAGTLAGGWAGARAGRWAAGRFGGGVEPPPPVDDGSGVHVDPTRPRPTGPHHEPTPVSQARADDIEGSYYMMAQPMGDRPPYSFQEIPSLPTQSRATRPPGFQRLPPRQAPGAGPGPAAVPSAVPNETAGVAGATAPTGIPLELAAPPPYRPGLQPRQSASTIIPPSRQLGPAPIPTLPIQGAGPVQGSLLRAPVTYDPLGTSQIPGSPPGARPPIFPYDPYDPIQGPTPRPPTVLPRNAQGQPIWSENPTTTQQINLPEPMGPAAQGGGGLPRPAPLAPPGATAFLESPNPNPLSPSGLPGWDLRRNRMMAGDVAADPRSQLSQPGIAKPPSPAPLAPPAIGASPLPPPPAVPKAPLAPTTPPPRPVSALDLERLGMEPAPPTQAPPSGVLQLDPARRAKTLAELIAFRDGKKGYVGGGPGGQKAPTKFEDLPSESKLAIHRQIDQLKAADPSYVAPKPSVPAFAAAKARGLRDPTPSPSAAQIANPVTAPATTMTNGMKTGILTRLGDLAASVKNVAVRNFSNLERYGREPSAKATEAMGDNPAGAKTAYAIAQGIGAARTAAKVRMATWITDANKAAGHDANAAVNASPVQPALDAMTYSRIVGKGNQYERLANVIEQSSDPDLRTANETWLSDILGAVDSVAYDSPSGTYGSGMRGKVAEMMAEGKLDDARAYVSNAFRGLAATVRERQLPKFHDAMVEKHGKTFQEIIADPQVAAAIESWKGPNGPGSAFAKFHSLNDGFLSEDMGPLNAYIPMVNATEASKMAAKTGLASLSTMDDLIPPNPTNNFMTGLGTYEATVNEIRQKLGGAIAANSKGGLMKELRALGLSKPVAMEKALAAADAPPGAAPGAGTVITYIPPPGSKGASSQPRSWSGNDLVTVEIDPTNPKIKETMPNWLWKEIEPLYKKSDFGTRATRSVNPVTFEEEVHWKNLGDKIANAALATELYGPIDNAYHAANVVGGFLFSVPKIAQGPMGRLIANSPATKKLSLGLQVASDVIDTARGKGGTLDPKNSMDLNAMAELGLLPSKYLSSTTNKGTGAALQIPSGRTPGRAIEAAMYGPDGLDARLRLRAYRALKAMTPDGRTDTPEFHKAFEGLLIYNQTAQSRIERALKGSAAGQLMAPFVTAGFGFLKTGTKAVTGQNAMPYRFEHSAMLGPKYGAQDVPYPQYMMDKLEAQWSGGVLGATIMWMGMHKAVTGKDPWDDPSARLFEVPVPDSIRKSPQGKWYWGDNPKTQYMSMRFQTMAPVRGAQATGVKGFVDTRMIGGTPTQAVESGAKDMINAIAHPLLGGPLPSTAIPMILGNHAYLQSLRDANGRPQPQFLSTLPTYESLPKNILARGGRGLAGVNPLIEDAESGLMAAYPEFFGQIPGFEGAPDRYDEGQKALRTMMDYVFAGHAGKSRHLPAEQQRIIKQQIGMKKGEAKQTNQKRLLGAR